MTRRRTPSGVLSEIKYGGLHGLCALDHLGERVQAALGALPQRVDLSRQGASRGSSVGQCWGGWEDAREEAGELASRTRPSSKTEPSGSASNADTSSAVSRSPRLPAATQDVRFENNGMYGVVQAVPDKSDTELRECRRCKVRRTRGGGRNGVGQAPAGVVR